MHILFIHLVTHADNWAEDMAIRYSRAEFIHNLEKQRLVDEQIRTNVGIQNMIWTRGDVNKSVQVLTTGSSTRPLRERNGGY